MQHAAEDCLDLCEFSTTITLLGVGSWQDMLLESRQQGNLGPAKWWVKLSLSLRLWCEWGGVVCVCVLENPKLFAFILFTTILATIAKKWLIGELYCKLLPFSVLKSLVSFNINRELLYPT